MKKKHVTTEQKKLDIDLWIIIISSVLVLCVYLVFNNQLMDIGNNYSLPVLLRLLLFASFQYGLAGLGITIISIIRKESFFSHGLKKDKALTSIFLSALCFLPYIIIQIATCNLTSYLPFQSVWTTKELLSSVFPTNAIGISITAIVWGFFEGFNYIVISDKINARYPSKNKWINWGAISCSIICILIHGAVGVTATAIIEMLSIIFLIYGMLIVKERTGNAWGAVFVFIFMWNAF